MAVIDTVKWNAEDNIYAWKFPSEELSTWTQLIVSESQEAVLLKGGKMSDPFKPGRHTLNTENIPILSTLVNIPFGGKSPFTAEVWFVNKTIPLDVKWGTSDPIQLQDPKYNIMLPIRAFGQFALQIEDSRSFLTKLVGTMPTFDQEKLRSYFKGLLLTKVKDLIARQIIRERVSILEINAYLSTISDGLKNDLQADFSGYGIRLVNFYVNSINTPEDDPAVRRLKKALAKKAEMDIIGYNYQQERSFDTLQAAAQNEGMSAGIMGAGMGVGMGVGMGSHLGAMMDQNIRPVAASATPISTSVPCPKCNQPNAPGSKFCAHCGQSVAPLVPACIKCHAPLTGESRFCGECGAPQVRNCGKCGATLPPGGKFCQECGTPIT